MSQTVQLLNGNIYKLTFKFLLSSILGTLAVSFYILFDTIFIGQAVGGNGLAALNICLPIYTLLSATGLLLGMGGGTFFSLAVGKKELITAHKTFTLSVFMGIIISLLFTLLGLLFLDELALVLGATPEIFNLVTEYMQYLFLFAPSFMLVHVLTVFIRNNNLPHIAMISTILSGVVNIILDIIFMFPLDMGMKGAALATCLSSILSLSVLIFYTLKAQGELKWHSSCFSFSLLKKIFSIGLPTFIVEICSGIVIFLFNIVLLQKVGTIGVSAYGIIANIALMAMAVFNGIGQGIQPLVSINHSAGYLTRTQQVIKMGLSFSLIVGVVFYLVGYFMGYDISNLFVSDDPAILEVATHAIPYYFIAFLVVGTNLIANYYYQAIGESKFSIMISLARGILFILVGFAFLPNLLGTNGIWLVVPFAEIMTLLSLTFLFAYTKKREVKMQLQ